VRPRLRRKRWEEIAEFVGSTGVVKYAGRDIPCVIKEVIIGEGRNGNPELSIVTEEGKRYPLKRFTPQLASPDKSTTPSAAMASLVERKAEQLINAGKGKLINMADGRHSYYEVKLTSSTSPRSVLFDELTKKVIKVL